MDPFTIAMLGSTAIKGTGSIANYLQNRKTAKSISKYPSFGDSSYFDMLTKRSQEGTLSPLAQQTIINQTGSRASGIAANTKADYMGRLINRGMGGSMAAQRGLNEVDQGVMQQVADTQAGLTTQNEQSKITAQDQLEQMKWQNKLAKYQAKLAGTSAMNQANTQLIGGLTDAGSNMAGGIGDYISEQELLKLLYSGGQGNSNQNVMGNGMVDNSYQGWMKRYYQYPGS